MNTHCAVGGMGGKALFYEQLTKLRCLSYEIILNEKRLRSL
jgi:hypothetical protein